MQETGRDVRGGALGGPAALESLEDPAYRGLPDLGYPSRQTFRTLRSVPSFMYSTCRQPPSHYFEQLDTYLHSGRDLDLELEGGRPGSQGQLEKKAKSGSGRREEGGLLPPLLALAPQVVTQTTCAIVPPISLFQERPPSPGHALKMDSYLCPGQDHLTAPYLPDGTIDYTNMDY